MTWSSKTQIITSGSVSTTEIFSSAVTLNSGELGEIQISANFPTTPTDNLIVGFYGTLDDSAETWDTVPFYTKTFSKDIDPNIQSIPITGIFKFRLGCKRDGTTDTITVNAYYKKDGVNL